MKTNELSVFHHHVLEFAKAHGIPLAEALAATRAMGFDGLVTERELLSDGDALKRLLGANGLRIVSVYDWIDFVHDDPAACARRTESLLSAAKAFGAESVLVLPGLFREGDDQASGLDRICAGLSEACRLASPLGIAVTIENFGLPASPNGTVAGCAAILERVPGLGFAFDTGNFACYGEDPHDAWPLLRDRVVFVHLKDRASGPDGLDTTAEVTIGDGVLDLGRLVRRMRADGYAGGFVAEHFGHPDQGTAMRRSADFFRGIVSRC